MLDIMEVNVRKMSPRRRWIGVVGWLLVAYVFGVGFGLTARRLFYESPASIFYVQLADFVAPATCVFCAWVAAREAARRSIPVHR